MICLSSPKWVVFFWFRLGHWIFDCTCVFLLSTCNCMCSVLYLTCHSYKHQRIASNPPNCVGDFFDVVTSFHFIRRGPNKLVINANVNFNILFNARGVATIRGSKTKLSRQNKPRRRLRIRISGTEICFHSHFKRKLSTIIANGKRFSCIWYARHKVLFWFALIHVVQSII